jgi:hypothetical protein
VTEDCKHERDSWFDRVICPPPCNTMHNRCFDCGKAMDHCAIEDDLNISTTFRTFLSTWGEYNRRNANQRPGQALMNVLYQFRRDIYQEMTGGEFDPFHDDNRLTDALIHIYQKWT